MHRFVWNLRGPDPVGVDFGYPISAVYMNTAKEPTGPWVLPGTYTVHLIVGGKSYNQPLEVRMDPRVRTSALALTQQHTLSVRIVADLRQSSDALTAIRQLRTRVKDARTSAQGAALAALDDFDRQLAALDSGAPSFGRLGGDLGGLYGVLQEAEVTQTAQALAAIADRRATLGILLARWQALRTAGLGSLNAKLRAAGVAEIR
jgi:hypothetical protein